MIRGPEFPLPEEALVEKNLRAHVNVLAVNIGERSIYALGSLQKAASYLKKNFSGMGYSTWQEGIFTPLYVAEWKAQIPLQQEPTENIIGEVRGTAIPEEIILLGAHYDTHNYGQAKNPGANDNASGIAVMLEVARNLSQKEMKRTVRFVGLTNEEAPFCYTPWQGSAVNARRARARGDKIIMAVVLEEVGCIVDGDCTKNYLACISYGPNLDKGVDVFEMLNQKGTVPVKLRISGYEEVNEFGQVHPEDTHLARSDHFQYINHGFPSIALTDTVNFRYSHYHQASDTPDKLNFRAMTDLVGDTSRLIFELANR